MVVKKAGWARSSERFENFDVDKQHYALSHAGSRGTWHSFTLDARHQPNLRRNSGSTYLLLSDLMLLANAVLQDISLQLIFYVKTWSSRSPSLIENAPVSLCSAKHDRIIQDAELLVTMLFVSFPRFCVLITLTMFCDRLRKVVFLVHEVNTVTRESRWLS
jgi:hypothetical protein